MISYSVRLLFNLDFLQILEWILYIIIIIFTGLYFYYYQRFKYWNKLNVKTVQNPEFLFGNIKDIIKMKTTFPKLLSDWYHQYKECKMIGFYNLFLPSLIPLDLELVKNILVKDFDHFHDHFSICNEELDPLSGNVFFLGGEKWKTIRSKVSHIFTPLKMKYMFGTIVKCSEEFENCLNEYVNNKEPIEVKSLACKYTINIVSSCLFANEEDRFKSSKNTMMLEKLMSHLNPTTIDRMKIFLNHYFPNLCNFLRIHQINKDLDSFIRNFVYDTTEFRRKNNIVRKDMLQLMLDLKIPKDEIETLVMDSDSDYVQLTLNEIAAQTFIFFIGGYETSSSLMSFLLYELAKCPYIQQKLREEVTSVLKKYDNKINFEAISEMNYLEMVVYESLRMHPIVGFLTRKVTKDYQIPDTDIVLKEGVSIFIPTLGIHYDSEYYPNPEVFDPERFTIENKAKRPDVTFLAFGAGQRFCVGTRFGLLQIKIGISRLISKYKFTINSKTKEPLAIDTNSMLTTAQDGIWLNVEKYEL